MADQKLTKLANDLVPILRRKLGTLQTGTGAAGVSGGSSGGELPNYLTEAEADLLYAALDSFVAHAANASAHHPRQHSVLSTDDHTIVAAAMRILGTPASANTLGLFVAGSDGSGGNVVLVTDANGDITVGVVNADELNVTDLTADNIVANVGVTTPKLTSDADLLIDPTNDLQLRPTGDILFSGRILSDALIGGDPAIYIDPDTGLIDSETIQAKEAVFDAVIAAAKRAEAGAIEITRSFAFLARAFTIPNEGATSTMYVSELESLPGYDPLGEGNIVKIPFFQAGGELQIPTTIEASDYDEATGQEAGSGSPTVYYDDDFSSGRTPYLFQSGDNNDLSNDGIATVDVYADSGNNVLRVARKNTNCHTHYAGGDAGDLTDYVFTGRFKPLAANVGIGFTLYSKYWGADPAEDRYYRVRRYGTSGSATFHVSNHGTGYSMTGTTTSSYDPSDDLNVWHRFKVQVEDDAPNGVRIRARFWLEGDSEPGTWDIDCHDSNSYLNKGSFGLWHMNGGPYNLYYDDLHCESVSSSAPAINTSLTLHLPASVEDDDMVVLVATFDSGAALGTPSGWALLETGTVGGVSSKLFHKRWNTGEPSTVTLALDTPDELFTRLLVIRGVRSLGQRSEVATFTNGEPEPPSISVATNGLHLAYFARHDGTTIAFPTAPTGYTSTTTRASTSYAHKYHYKRPAADGTAAPAYDPALAGSNYVAFSYAVDPEDGVEYPFYVGAAWGTVEKTSPQPGDVSAGEVAYEFSMLESYRSEDGQVSPAAGRTAQIDAVVQDYGPTTGDSYIIATVLDRTGSPYIRLARHTGFNPATGRLDASVMGQFGSLSGLGADFETGENGLVVYKDSGPGKAIFSTIQMLTDGVDAYWRDEDGAVIVSILENEGISLWTQITEGDAGLASGGRNYTYVDEAGNVVAGLFYSAFVPSNPILPEGSRLAMRISGDGPDGVEALLVSSNTDNTRSGRSGLYAYSGSYEGSLLLEQTGAASYLTATVDQFDISGDLQVDGEVYVGGSNFGNLSGTRLTVQSDSDWAGFNFGQNSDNRAWFMWHVANKYVEISTRSSGTTYAGTLVVKDGQVGIKTYSPSYTLHVNGSVAGTSAYNNLSDERAKRNITRDDIGYGLDTILKLRPARFDYIDGPKDQLGFIAQDVRRIVPEMVSEADDGTLSTRESHVISILVKAMQQISERVASLERRTA